MALYERKEFCKKCDISSAYLTVNIGRKNVILKDGKIDDSNPINKLFLDKRLATIAAKAVKSPNKGKLKAVKKEPGEKGSKGNESTPPVDQAALEAFELDVRKKQIAVEKAEEDLELARFKREKQRGELIPMDLVKVVFATHSKSITTSFKEGIDNMLSTIAKGGGLDREHVAKIRGDLIGVINKAVKQAQETSRNDIKNIMMEYSELRGVGEKK